MKRLRPPFQLKGLKSLKANGVKYKMRSTAIEIVYHIFYTNWEVLRQAPRLSIAKEGNVFSIASLCLVRFNNIDYS